MACKDERVIRLLRSVDVAEYTFRRSSMRSADCIFAKMPTSSKVLDVRMHVSRNPEDRSRPARLVLVDSKMDAPDNRSYTAKGGKSSAVHPDIDEYDAEANR